MTYDWRESGQRQRRFVRWQITTILRVGEGRGAGLWKQAGATGAIIGGTQTQAASQTMRMNGMCGVRRDAAGGTCDSGSRFLWAPLMMKFCLDFCRGAWWSRWQSSL